MSVIKMTDLDLAGKRVFIRADLNVPVKDGKVTSDARIRASLPTIELALKQGAKVMVTSHLGRPTEGEYNEEFSLLPVVNYLKDKLSNPVRLVKDYLDGVDVAEGELVVLENVRFNKGEKKDDETLSKKYAALCDVFVMDAFGTAHRAQASTHGIGKFADVACAGPLLAAELDALALIILATMFLKQHSVLDVFGAVIMAYVLYKVGYEPEKKMIPQLSKQKFSKQKRIAAHNK